MISKCLELHYLPKLPQPGLKPLAEQDIRMNVKEEYSAAALKYKLSEESLRKGDELRMSQIPKANDFSIDQYTSSLFTSNSTASKGMSLFSGLNETVKVKIQNDATKHFPDPF